ncbi:MAG: ribosomal protein S18-alanine N-acetyltransferase [Methanosphaera sp.]|nr:ribosomal protein S18-alanine N-acetyltransferase [Methanosphaera sp.]
MRIRDFKLSDLDDVLKIEFDVFSDPYPADILIKLYESGVGFAVVELAHSVVGYIIYWVKDGNGHIIAIAIDKNYQGMGIGSRILDIIIDIFGKNDIHNVILEVRKSNLRAIKFYKNHGFITIDEQPNYYEDGETAIIMKCSTHNNT